MVDDKNTTASSVIFIMTKSTRLIQYNNVHTETVVLLIVFGSLLSVSNNQITNIAYIENSVGDTASYTGGGIVA